ncbi:14881_t:CDS:1, partial [Cetraspora pellucida]
DKDSIKEIVYVLQYIKLPTVHIFCNQYKHQESSKVEEIAYLSIDLPSIRTPTVIIKRKKEDSILTNKIKNPVSSVVLGSKVLLTSSLYKKNLIFEIIDLYIGSEVKKAEQEPSKQMINKNGLED